MLNGKGDDVAIYYDSPVTDSKSSLTYRELLEQVRVGACEGVLIKHICCQWKVHQCISSPDESGPEIGNMLCMCYVIYV